jgi:hypothetical protein
MNLKSSLCRTILTAVLSASLFSAARGAEPPASTRPKGGGSAPPAPVYVHADVHPSGGPSNLNGVFEPGETVLVEPAWQASLMFPAIFTSTASGFTGPPTATYTILDGSAHYSIPAGAIGECDDCFVMSIDDPIVRPAMHWDAQFNESAVSASSNWFLHIGHSFSDVPDSHLFYTQIERILHSQVTTGCGSGNFCASASITRAQMAVFILKAKLGPAYVPPTATGSVFDDVPVGSFAADWIEDLSSRGIVSGCQTAPALYCPSDPVSRADMAVIIVKARHDPGYNPPPCTGVFADVPCSPTPAVNVDWIEELYHEGITGGCGGGNFCPDALNTRGQIAVFLAKGLLLTF